MANVIIMTIMTMVSVAAILWVCKMHEILGYNNELCRINITAIYLKMYHHAGGLIISNGESAQNRINAFLELTNPESDKIKSYRDELKDSLKLENRTINVGKRIMNIAVNDLLELKDDVNRIKTKTKFDIFDIAGARTHADIVIDNINKILDEIKSDEDSNA